MESAETATVVSGKTCMFEEIEATLAELLREHREPHHEGRATVGAPAFSHSITALPGGGFLVTLIAVRQLA